MSQELLTLTNEPLILRYAKRHGVTVRYIPVPSCVCERGLIASVDVPPCDCNDACIDLSNVYLGSTNDGDCARAKYYVQFDGTNYTMANGPGYLFQNPYSVPAIMRYVGDVDDDLVFNDTVIQPVGFPYSGGECNGAHSLTFCAPLGPHETFRLGASNNFDPFVGLNGKICFCTGTITDLSQYFVTGYMGPQCGENGRFIVRNAVTKEVSAGGVIHLDGTLEVTLIPDYSLFTGAPVYNISTPAGAAITVEFVMFCSTPTAVCPTNFDTVVATVSGVQVCSPVKIFPDPINTLYYLNPMKEGAWQGTDASTGAFTGFLNCSEGSFPVFYILDTGSGDIFIFNGEGGASTNPITLHNANVIGDCSDEKVGAYRGQVVLSW